MYKNGGAHARRAVEADIVAYADGVLAAPETSFSVALLVGSRAHGIREVLVQGVVPQLAERAAVAGAEAPAEPVRVRGEWSEGAPVQYCVAEGDVPPAPPAADGAARLLLVACFDMDRLPAWVMSPGDHYVRTLPVGPLTLFEAQGFVEARLGGPVDPADARTLATLARFTPLPLTVIIDECRSQGALERLDGMWSLLADPVQSAIVPYLRAQLTAAGPAIAGMLFRFALTEPFSDAHLTGGESKLVDQLLSDGELLRRDDGRLEYTALASSVGLRALAPAEEQARIYRAELRAGTPTVHAIRWAARTGHPLEPDALERVAEAALSEHDWQSVVDIADAADAAEVIGDDVIDRENGDDGDDGADGTAAPVPPTVAVRTRLHLRAAYAARFLADADLAHAHLDHAEDELEELNSEAAGDTRIRIRLLRADLAHYREGDLDDALDELRGEGDERDDARLRSHVVLHQVYGGRHRDARDTLAESKRTLRRAPRRLRDRVAIAEAHLQSASGKPARALRKIALMAARHRLVAERSQWLTEELRAAYVSAALSSDGPAALGLLEKHLGETQSGTYRPDLVTFYFAQASWEYTRGEIEAAHRLGSLALETAQTVDPSGIEASAIALVAETAALRGDHARAVALVDRFAAVSPRSSAVIAGSLQRHIASAQLLLASSHAGESLRQRAAQFVDDGQFGFAAEALYAGVRFGRRRAARDLCAIGDELDGNLHRMRRDQAAALLADDPLALLDVAERLARAGLRLYAAEAAATAIRLPDAPDSLVRRATNQVAALLSEQPLSGHALLRDAVPIADDSRLTARERDVTRLIELGLSNTEIATQLHLSLATIEGHITRIYRKTGQRRRAPARQTGVE